MAADYPCNPMIDKEVLGKARKLLSPFFRVIFAVQIGKPTMSRKLFPRAAAILGLAGTLLAAAGTSQASPIASDSLAYADGALAGNAGGSGWGGAWSGAATVAGGVATTASGQPGNRALGASIVPTAGQSLWVSFLMGSETSGTNDFSALAFIGAGGAVLSFANNFNTGVYGIDIVGVRNTASTEAVSIGMRRLIGEVLFNSATDLTVNLYLDDASNLVSTYTGAFASNRGAWESVRIASQNASATFDDIRIGTTLADVAGVPEPSSVLLAAAALLGLVVASRRAGRQVR